MLIKLSWKCLLCVVFDSIYVYHIFVEISNFLNDLLNKKMFILCNENIWESLWLVTNQTYICTTIKDNISCYCGFYIPSITFFDTGHKSLVSIFKPLWARVCCIPDRPLLRSLNTGARSIMSVTHYDSTSMYIALANYSGLGCDRWRSAQIDRHLELLCVIRHNLSVWCHIMSTILIALEGKNWIYTYLITRSPGWVQKSLDQRRTTYIIIF